MSVSPKSGDLFQQLAAGTLTPSPQRRPPHEQLGLLVLEKTRAKSADRTLLGVGLFFVTVGITALVVTPGDWTALFAGGLGLIGAGMGGWRLLNCPRWFFYEKGLIQRTRWDESTVLYTDVAELTYVSTQIIVNLQYFRTAVEMHLRPRSGSGKIRVEHSYREQPDSERQGRMQNVVEQVRDMVAQDMAARMFDELRQMSFVRWTEGVVIRRDGLEVTSRNGATQRFAWKQLTR